MININYIIAIIHKCTNSMALKNAISNIYNIEKNNIQKFDEKTIIAYRAAKYHPHLCSVNDAIRASLVSIYNSSDYSFAHRLLEIGLYDDPKSDVATLLMALNLVEKDPMQKQISDFMPRKIISQNLNQLLAVYSVERDSIPDSMDFFIQSIESDHCIESKLKTLRMLNNAAKKYFTEKKIELNSSLFKEKLDHI